MKKGRPPVHINITYEELGEYVGAKAVVRVTKEWFDSLTGIEHTKKGCTKCNELLPLDKFNTDKRRLQGKRSQCKSCYKKGSNSRAVALTSQEEPKIEYKLTDLND